jgi:phenylalanyl-tRNA synthetase alpha chain
MIRNESGRNLIGMEDIDQLREEILREVREAGSSDALEAVRLAALGRRGRLTVMMRSLSALDPEARRIAGAALNLARDKIAAALAEAGDRLRRAALALRLAGERADVTLPVLAGAPGGTESGRIHPISQTIDEIIAIFGEMGFVVAEGPHIEDDFHNFTALNIPPEHPARQEHDTFYLPERPDGSRLVLRTHTSPVQIRAMQRTNEAPAAGYVTGPIEPPIRIIVPGRTYRNDSDQTHTPMFHQLEGLVIDKSSHIGQLRWVLEEFLKAFFEVESVVTRFRPSFFPFTEPSMEVDVRCDRRGGEIRIGEGNDWLEILGCGMVHPNVLRNCKLDPDVYQGFAWGMGIDRLAMLKYGMSDLRAFFEADKRWLDHYGFRPLDLPTLFGGLSS